MNSKLALFSRRRFLKGLGVTVSLPFLESLLPKSAFAQNAAKPKRFVVLYKPHGMNMREYALSATGDIRSAALSYTLNPLTSLRSDILVVSNLEHTNGYGYINRNGDHARSAGGWLQPHKVPHPDEYANYPEMSGRSIDRIIAAASGRPFVYCTTTSDGGDSGYHQSYTGNISFDLKLGRDGDRNPGNYSPRINDPRLMWDLLFKDGASAAALDPATRAAVLSRESLVDLVKQDSAALRKELCVADRCRLDDYLDSLNELEARVIVAADDVRNGGGNGLPLPGCTKPVRPATAGANAAEMTKLFMDLMVVAFQCDKTRNLSMLLDREGSGRSFNFFGASDIEPFVNPLDGTTTMLGSTDFNLDYHNDVSHHLGNTFKAPSDSANNNAGTLLKQHKQKIIDRWYVKQFAYLVERLKATPDPFGGTLLENSVVMFGSGLSDSNQHSKRDIPLVLAGQGGGAIRTGRHLRLATMKPFMAMHYSLARKFGINIADFGGVSELIDL